MCIYRSRARVGAAAKVLGIAGFSRHRPARLRGLRVRRPEPDVLRRAPPGLFEVVEHAILQHKVTLPIVAPRFRRSFGQPTREAFRPGRIGWRIYCPLHAFFGFPHSAGIGGAKVDPGTYRASVNKHHSQSTFKPCQSLDSLRLCRFSQKTTESTGNHTCRGQCHVHCHGCHSIDF